MKLTPAICALALVAALGSNAFAAGSAGAGDNGVNAQGTVNGTVNGTANGNVTANGNATAGANDTGMATLGVDISGAGDTSTSVQSFNNNLTAEQQAQVTSGCTKVTADPSKYAANIQAYCKNSMTK